MKKSTHDTDSNQAIKTAIQPMRKGLVSVVVPVYNRESLVRETVDSILAQTYKDIEIIAVNDGSTDESLNVLECYRSDFPDRIRVIDQINKGQVAARNTAIAQAQGEFIAFLDSDDLWLPEKLEKQIPLFVSNVGLVYSGIYNVDANGDTIDTNLCNEDVKGYAHEQLLVSNQMTGGTVVVTRTALNEVGIFDESLSAAENWDLWIRISERYSVDFVNEPLVKYRKHGGNMSKDHSLMINAINNILDKHCSGLNQSPGIECACLEARATCEYRQGVYHFSRQEYVEARRYFRNALKLKPDFRDSRIRLARTWIGKAGNQLLSKLKSRGSA